MPRLHVSPEVPLYYEVRGEGPPLVLLNGLSQSTANWMSQSRRLAQRFTVISFDARGQGKTPTGDEPLELDLFLGDLDVLLDRLGHERVHVCGFSYGARVALAYAARRAHRVDRLILTSIGADVTALRRLIVRSWRQVLELGGLEAMAWCALPHILGAEFIQQYERQIPAMVKASVQRNTVAGLCALMDAMAHFIPPEDDAARVQAETLILVADADPLVPVHSAQALARRIERARVELIPNSGHTLPIERPEVWREAVLRFLGEGA